MSFREENCWDKWTTVIHESLSPSEHVSLSDGARVGVFTFAFIPFEKLWAQRHGTVETPDGCRAWGEQWTVGGSHRPALRWSGRRRTLAFGEWRWRASTEPLSGHFSPAGRRWQQPLNEWTRWLCVRKSMLHCFLGSAQRPIRGC